LFEGILIQGHNGMLVINKKYSMEFSQADSPASRCEGFPTFRELFPDLQGVLVVS